MKNALASLLLFLFILPAALPARADPTVMTRVIGGGVILYGLRPSGMGGATLGVQSPATLWKIPSPAASLDFGYSTLEMDTPEGKDEAGIPLFGGGVAFPFGERWGFAFRALRIATNTFRQQENAFAPMGDSPFRAEARDIAFLAAASKGVTENFSLGLALALYGKSTYEIESEDGNRRRYELLERFSPLLFVHWQAHPRISLGGQVSFINAVQAYEGQDFAAVGTTDVMGNPQERLEAGAVHYEYRLGAAVHLIEGMTIAADGEYHFTDAPLHPLLGPHEEAGGHGIESSFDSLRWYAGIEQWFSFGLPADILALRAGIFDEESYTAGLSFRFPLGGVKCQVDYAYVRNHSKKEFDEFEPDLFGESSNSHGLTVTALF